MQPPSWEERQETPLHPSGGLEVPTPASPGSAAAHPKTNPGQALSTERSVPAQLQGTCRRRGARGKATLPSRGGTVAAPPGPMGPGRPHRSGLKLNWCRRRSASSERYSLMKRSLLP